MRKRFLALLLAALLLACAAAPALANEGGPVTSTGTIWSNWAGESPDWLQTMIGSVAPSACPVSSDGKHHGKVIDKNPNGNNWIAKCSYCSDTFPVYDDDMQNAYNGHVGDIQSELGTTQVGSNGYIIPLTPTRTAYQSRVHSYYNATYPVYSSLVFVTDSSSSPVGYRFDMFEGSDFFTQLHFPGSGYLSYILDFSLSDSSLYKRVDCGLFMYPDSQSTSGKRIPVYPKKNSVSSSTCVKFNFFSLEFTHLPSDTLLTYSYRFALFYEPFSWNVNDFTVNIGGIDSRYGNFVGNLGYYRDGDQITVNENITLVNENTNSFYSFLSDSSRPIESWTYDYATRTYELTLEGGEKVTVVYGDEAITITEGDTTYTVYYVVGPGEEEPLPTPTPTPSVTPTPTPPVDPTPTPTAPVDPTPTPTAPIDPTDPPGPIDPDNPPDTSGWGLLDFLKGIFDAILNFGGWLKGVFTDLLDALFTPNEETTDKIQGAITEKLPFVSDLQAFGDDLVSVLNNPAASAKAMRYTTVIDLGRKTKGVSYGDGQVDVLDMSWYLEYKPLGDDIIEGVAWLVFLWNLYGAIPGIIHGGASALQSTASIQKQVDKLDRHGGGDD